MSPFAIATAGTKRRDVSIGMNATTAAWWRHHHNNTRFVLFGGGYYFWNNNYWYPAYGYDPAYSRYTYDEPIYGYNNYEPGQVISNVQSQLQREGYYDGEIDGLDRSDDT